MTCNCARCRKPLEVPDHVHRIPGEDESKDRRETISNLTGERRPLRRVIACKTCVSPADITWLTGGIDPWRLVSRKPPAQTYGGCGGCGDRSILLDGYCCRGCASMDQRFVEAEPT
jgi:hypothetical protein